MEWIRVEDGLPEEGAWVIVWPEPERAPVAIFMHTPEPTFGIDGRTFHVTHWMGMPEPPDGEADICGLCGGPGADKMAAHTGSGALWPGETRPDTDMVHSECEQEETRRAHSLLSDEQRRDFLEGIR